MECLKFRNLLPDLIDGTLSDDLNDFARRHCESCEECRKLFYEHKETISRVKENVMVPEYSESFWRSRYQELLTRAEEVRRRNFSRGFRFAAGITFLAIAALLAGRAPKQETPLSLATIPVETYRPYWLEPDFFLPEDELKEVVHLLKQEDQSYMMSELLK
jgi:anti-sigma factor RsiW